MTNCIRILLALLLSAFLVACGVGRHVSRIEPQLKIGMSKQEVQRLFREHGNDPPHVEKFDFREHYGLFVGDQVPYDLLTKTRPGAEIWLAGDAVPRRSSTVTVVFDDDRVVGWATNIYAIPYGKEKYRQEKLTACLFLYRRHGHTYFLNMKSVIDELGEPAERKRLPNAHSQEMLVDTYWEHYIGEDMNRAERWTYRYKTANGTERTVYLMWRPDWDVVWGYTHADEESRRFFEERTAKVPPKKLDDCKLYSRTFKR
jgi:hypothetical protein